MTATEEAPLVKYSVSDSAIAELRTQFEGLTCDTKDGYEATRKAIATTRGFRVGIEKRRKELKEESLKWGRLVDSEAKRLTGMLSAIEDPLQAAKDAGQDGQGQGVHGGHED